MILRAEYDELNSFRTTSSRLRLNQSSCDQGDKSGELLARQIKQLETKTSRTSIISNDQVTVNPIKIMLLESSTIKKMFNLENLKIQNGFIMFVQPIKSCGDKVNNTKSSIFLFNAD